VADAVQEVKSRGSRLSGMPFHHTRIGNLGNAASQTDTVELDASITGAGVRSHVKAPRNHTLELQNQVAAAHTPTERVEALLRLALWCVEAERSRARAATGEVLAEATKLRDPILLARARYSVALAAVYTHDEVAPYHDLLHLSREFETFGLQSDAAWCDLAAAMALESMGDPGGSVLLTERALGTFRRYGDLAGQSRCLNTIGIGECWVGRYAEAIPIFGRAADLAAAAKRPATYAVAWLNAVQSYTNLGRRAREEGRPDWARALFEHAEAEFEPLWRQLVALGYRQLQPQVAALQATTLLNLGREAEAATAAERALGLAVTSGSTEALASARCHAAEVQLRLGDFERARKLFSTALAEYEMRNHHTETARVIRGLVETNEALGDVKTAFELHKRLLDVELAVRSMRQRREREVSKARLELANSRGVVSGDDIAGNGSPDHDGATGHGASDAGSAKELTDELARDNERLERDLALLQRLAHTDPLTGLANRRHFDVQLARATVRSELTHRPLAVVIADIDFFKTINDRFSHVAGDEVLRRLAATLRAMCRGDDIAARVGGEEFALLLPHTDIAAAAGVAERIRTAISRLDVTDVCPGWTVTVSSGAAAMLGSRPAELYGAADAALYRAKAQGRNRVCVAEEVGKNSITVSV